MQQIPSLRSASTLNKEAKVFNNVYIISYQDFVYTQVSLIIHAYTADDDCDGFIPLQLRRKMRK